MKRFIIHTNSYAGNFEREMCAYITGHVGCCGVGNKMVDDEFTKIFQPFILQRDEDNKGCERPVTIYPNPRYSNNGLGHSFDHTNLEECIKAQKAHSDYIKNDKLKKLKEALDFYKGTRADTSDLKAEVESVEKEISDYMNIPPMEIPYYPSYNSVCIYFKDNTPKHIFELAKERANSYEGNIIIEGFDIIDESEKTQKNESDCDNDTDVEIKVTVTAYKEHIIIQTKNIDIYDKDFSPRGNGRIGCVLSNPKKLGISKEALELLNKIERCRDAIGDFMGDENSFGWIGDTHAIKNLKSVGARDFKLPKHIEINNEVEDSAIEYIENDLKNSEEGNKKIEYSDVIFEPWLEIRESNDKESFNVSFCFMIHMNMI